MIALRNQATATLSGSTYSFAFAAVAQGQAASVTVSVPGAPADASWTVYAGNLPVGSLAGSNGLAGVYLASGEAVSISGTSSTAPGIAIEVGQQGSATEVPVSVPTPTSSTTNIGAEVTIKGPISVSGTVDANVTNATLDISGTVAVSEVTEVTGTVTIDANGSNVTVAAVNTGELQTTISYPATSASVTTTTGINSLIITALPSEATVKVAGASVGSVPCDRAANSDGFTYTWIADLPAADTYTVTVSNLIGTGWVFGVYSNSGIEHVNANLIGPFVQGMLPVNTLQVTDSYNYAAGSSSWTMALGLGQVAVLVMGTAGNYLTSAVDSLGGPVPFRQVQLNGTSRGPAYLIVNPAGDLVTLTANEADAPAVSILNGLPSSLPFSVQTVSVTEPAAGADWSYTLPYAARVKFVQATLTLSAQSGDRNPALYTSQMHYTDWANGVSVTSGSGNYQAFPGGPVPAVFESLYGNYIMGIPDFGVLPAGTVIGSFTGGIQTGDQWSSISLVLEPA